LARHGNVEAQYRLGLTFEYGASGKKEQIKPDIREAARWFKQAAENGHQEVRSRANAPTGSS